MIIREAEFVTSSTKLVQCPPPDLPEFAFIGRSNVGKSSLINMLVQRKQMARTSARPGKTQTINHYQINGAWYLVDLPGYGYAGVSQTQRSNWTALMDDYFLHRKNLLCTFVLLDSRLEPQAKDLDFISWLGKNEKPLALVLTKCDKLSRNHLRQSVQLYQNRLLRIWEELPPFFLTSSEKRQGRDDILGFIESALSDSSGVE